MSITFEHRVADLRKYLVNRGYKEKFVRDQINKVRELDQDKLLAPR